MKPFKTAEELAKFLEKALKEHNKRNLKQVDLTVLTQNGEKQ